MEPGGRRRDGPPGTRVDRLVIGTVAIVVEALGGDVRRQRNVPESRDRLVQDGSREVEAQQHLSPLPFGLDGGIERAQKAGLALSSTETDAVADRQPLARPG